MAGVKDDICVHMKSVNAQVTSPGLNPRATGLAGYRLTNFFLEQMGKRRLGLLE